MGVAALVGSVAARSITLFLIAALVIATSTALLWLEHKRRWTDRHW